MSFLLKGAQDGVNRLLFAKLHDEYATRGLKILAFPCNQFGAQEPGTEEEILEFVKKYDEKMAEKLVFFEKGSVNGSDTREVFAYLKEKLPDDDGTTAIRWNFNKFLVDHTGTPIKRFVPTVAPFDMKDDIESLLKKKEGGN
ncbi:glutathione S-transferase domain containing protein [Nitzschia inconspicua]|uniref:Glutathione S-transferase domain containing protein n=1 Tax=Nitzschia inconspicua TaxID=303405 RepID=A0A9K3KTX7_9STRA|nr:glutathione S-transferase domain containing protein [Nitzschia inconspicua]